MLAAGRLRHLVQIQQLTVELDSDDGARTEEWSDVFPTKLPAEITPMSGRELIAAQAVQAKVTTRIVIRYRPGIKASMRALHRSTVYDIEAVVPDPESGREWITLHCSDGVNDG